MRVENLLKQLRREYLKVKVLQSLLDGLLFFMATNLVLFLLNLNLVNIGSQELSVLGLFNITIRVALLGLLSIGFSAASLYHRFQQYEVEIFEQENPELREILRTARDNLDQQTIVSQALFEEVMDQARRVTSESIIPARSIIYKTMAVGILAFLTVLSGLADFQLQSSRDLLTAPGSIPGIDGGGENDTYEVKDGSGIYGDASDIDSSDLAVEFNVTGRGEGGSSNFEPGDAPPEEELRLDGTPDGYRDTDLARKYSIAVREFG